MQTETTCFSTMTGGKADRALGVISGVSVITEGDAKGHGIKIDHKTLETVLSVASEFSAGVKVKARHRQDKEHQNVLEATLGVLKSFKLDGNKVRADLHLLKSLSTEVKEKIFEMAEIMPEEFGLSIDFSGISEEKDGIKYARCTDLRSVDLSDNPAANPDGLFSAMEKKEHKEDCMCADCKKLSDEKKSKTMSAIFAKALGLPDTATETEVVSKLMARLSEKPAVITYKLDGKDVEMTGDQIHAKLAEADKNAADAKKNSDLTARNGIIAKMDTEGRVPMNPATKKAYTLAELQALPIETLQFAAINSPVIPLEAKAVYQAGDKPKVDPALKGSERVQAAWSQKYGNLDQMLSAPINGNA